jgi:hypothetical protein
MIVKNWMKAIVLAGAASLIPAVGFAKTHYTGKVSSDFANVVNPVVLPTAFSATTTAVSTKHTTGVKHHHKKKLVSHHHKHKLLSHKKKV